MSFLKIVSNSALQGGKTNEKNILFTETDAQKFKAKFEECRIEVEKREKKGKGKSVVECHS